MKPTGRAGHTDDEAAIRHAIDVMTHAFNTREEDVALSLMTSDADFVNVMGTWSRGAAEIARARQGRFATALRNASIRIVDVHVRFIRSDVALAHVVHEITGMLDGADEEVPTHRELSLRVFVKDDGKWFVRAFQNTTVGDSSARSGK